MKVSEDNNIAVYDALQKGHPVHKGLARWSNQVHNRVYREMEIPVRAQVKNQVHNRIVASLLEARSEK